MAEDCGSLALTRFDEVLELRIGGSEHRGIDLELAAQLVDEARREAFEPRTIGVVAACADRCGGKVVEEPPRRMLPVGEKCPVDERRLEDRHLEPPEELAQRPGDRVIAEDVVEQQGDHVDRDLVGWVDDAIGDRSANPRDAVLRHWNGFGGQRLVGGCAGTDSCPRIGELPAIERRDHGGDRPKREQRVELRQTECCRRRGRGCRHGPRELRSVRIDLRGGRGGHCRDGTSGRWRRRCLATGRCVGHRDVDREIGRCDLLDEAAEQGQEVAVVRGAQLAPRPQFGLDLRQNVAIGQQSIQPDV